MIFVPLVSFPYFSEHNIVIRALVDAYCRTEHWSTKRQLLSIVAADLPARLLKAEFPGLTNWKINAARKQAFFQGREKATTQS